VGFPRLFVGVFYREDMIESQYEITEIRTMIPTNTGIRKKSPLSKE
jgi:hypothetical protein